MPKKPVNYKTNKINVIKYFDANGTLIINAGPIMIDIRGPHTLFVDLDGWTYEIDDSTGEQIMRRWKSTD